MAAADTTYTTLRTAKQDHYILGTMKFLLYPLGLSALSFILIYISISVKGHGAGIGTGVFIIVAVLISFVIGLLSALVCKKWPKTGNGIALLYGIFCVVIVTYSTIRYSVIPDCERNYMWEFKRTQDIKLLDKWCVRDTAMTNFYSIVERQGNKTLFNDMLARGIHHPDPDCAYLLMAVVNNDINEIERLIGQGVSGQCSLYGRSPMSSYTVKNRQADANPEMMDKILQALEKKQTIHD